MVNFALRYPLIYKFSNLRKTETAALQVLHGFAYDVIRKRRKELTEQANRPETNNDTDDVAADEVGIRKKRALLDILLHSSIDGNPLTDLDISEEVSVFMFGVDRFVFTYGFFLRWKTWYFLEYSSKMLGFVLLFRTQGHDTTISAITFCLFNLAKYPDIQQKCFDEVCKVFGAIDAADQPATLPLLNQLAYLELTIKESLRIFSTIPLIARKAMEDIKLSKRYPFNCNCNGNLCFLK